MRADRLEALLHHAIPLAGALQVRVAEVGVGGIRLQAPLAPNRNHRGTGFGGSLSALGILAGWSLVRAGLADEDLDGARLVIQRHEIDFGAPATGALTGPPPP
ncbi:MAG: YiiD C-terminal domain-containing protein, partial [Trueperaceae bacterium]